MLNVDTRYKYRTNFKDAMDDNLFDFEKYIDHIRSTLATGKSYRLWGVSIKEINNIEDTMQCLYTNTLVDVGFRTDSFRFVRMANGPIVQRQILLDTSIPGRLILTGHRVTTVTSIREFHCVLSKNKMVPD